MRLLLIGLIGLALLGPARVHVSGDPLPGGPAINDQWTRPIAEPFGVLHLRSNHSIQENQHEYIFSRCGQAEAQFEKIVARRTD
jgi:hypothetical protein